MDLLAIFEIRACRTCGCTDDNCYNCIERTGMACHWVEADLCSACVGLHSDDIAVDRFAAAMNEKLAADRAKARSGWKTCPEDTLITMLKNHIEKGDMVDVANFAMFIHLNREDNPVQN